MTLSGRSVFGGMLQNTHFGHFVAESLSRLWAISLLGPEVERIVFNSRVPGKPVSRWASDVIGALTDVPIKVIDRCTTCDVLAIPSQIVHTNGVIFGHPAIRDLVLPLRQLRSTLPGGKRLYISRSKLTHQGGILQELMIERNLQAQGYRILHLQEVSIREQLEAYNSAEHLVFAEGSALHLYSLVAHEGQHAFVIPRRKMPMIFNWQLKSFGAGPLHGRPSITRLWLPEVEYGTTTKAKAELDFADLGQQLSDLGFITLTDWMIPSQADIDAEMHGITSKANFIYAPVPFRR